VATIDHLNAAGIPNRHLIEIRTYES